MDPFSLCCVTCLSLADPGSSGTFASRPGGDVAFEARSSLSVALPEDALELTPAGFEARELRLGLAAGLTPALGVTLAFDAADLVTPGTAASAAGSEAYLDARFGRAGIDSDATWGGLHLRVGRFRAGPGIAALRPHQRCFTDASLATERFFGDRGLVDQGLSLRWDAPSRTVPFGVTLFALSGLDSPSFDPVAPVDAASVFSGLLVGARLHIDLGSGLIGPRYPIALSLSWMSGQNGTGPENRTDLLHAGLSSVIPLEGGWALGVDVEYQLRRWGIPYALVAEGGLGIAFTATHDQLQLGLRFDQVGLPKPTFRPEPGDPNPPAFTAERLERYTALASWAFTPEVILRAQYALRDDTSELRSTGDGDYVHSGSLELVFGWAGSAGSSRPVADDDGPPGREPVRRTEPRPEPIVMAPEAWIAQAGAALGAAEALGAASDHAASVTASREAAYLALRARLAALRITAPRDRSCTTALEVLTRDGAAPPPELWSAARALDRHALATGESPLGGEASRFYDRETAAMALQSARALVAWATAHPAPPAPATTPTPPVAPAPTTPPPEPVSPPPA
ncbi:MAG: HEPN domain-containing protein [Myxococcales bacterium]|nr:HEPN domain-containing protein [Myxococcales bacterium]